MRRASLLLPVLIIGLLVWPPSSLCRPWRVALDRLGDDDPDPNSVFTR